MINEFSRDITEAGERSSFAPNISAGRVDASSRHAAVKNRTSNRTANLKGSGHKSAKSGGVKRGTFKVNYVRGKGAKVNVKASGRYMLTRKDELGEPGDREGYSKDKEGFTRQYIYNIVDQADEKTFQYRMIISPKTDKNMQGIDTHAYVREVMKEVEARQGDVSWVAVDHVGKQGHSKNGHIHVLAMMAHKLERDDLAAMREHVGEKFEASLERKLDKGLDFDAEYNRLQIRNRVSSELEQIKRSDMELDKVENGGTGLLTRDMLETYYDNLKQSQPELFQDGKFKRFEKVSFIEGDTKPANTWTQERDKRAQNETNQGKVRAVKEISQGPFSGGQGVDGEMSGKRSLQEDAGQDMADGL